MKELTTLDAADAAVVFKADGTVEGLIPEPDDEGMVGRNTVLVGALMMFISDTAAFAELVKKFTVKMDNASEEPGEGY